MRVDTGTNAKDAQLNMRMPKAALCDIDAKAQRLGMSRSQFVTEVLIQADLGGDELVQSRNECAKRAKTALRHAQKQLQAAIDSIQE